MCFFFSEGLEAFCSFLTLLPIRKCWPVRPWLFKFFSLPTACSMLNNWSADLLPAPSISAPPFSGDSVVISAVASGPLTSLSNEIAVAVAHALHRFVPTFVATFRAENLTARFPAWLFPVFSIVFPRCFQICLGCYQLALLSCRYVEIAAILCLPSPLFLPTSFPGPFLARPTWLGRSRLQLWRRMFFFPAFTSHRERLD